MASIKMPPIEKVHEALSAIADERVILKESSAEVFSSDKSKKYLVEWENNTYSSNDNASYWKGYVGYPIIAVLLIQNKLNYNSDMLTYFKDINWKEINTRYSNNYSMSVEEVFNSLKSIEVDTTQLNQEIFAIYRQLAKLEINLKRSKIAPPK